MTTPPPESLTPGQSRRLDFEAGLAELQRADQARLGAEALLWLALTPCWTVPLAQDCGFPAADLPGFIHQAESAGLCATSASRALDGSQTVSFWMPGSVVAAQLPDLKSRFGAQGVHTTAVEIGRRILQARSGARAQGEVQKDAAGQNSGITSLPGSGAGLPAGVIRWAELAQRTEKGLPYAAEWLGERIQKLVKAGETGEALAWTNTGAALAQTLGGEIETAVLTGRRRVELAYRADQDARSLENYLEITDQVQAFAELLEEAGREAPWALHYIGMGGVGKTMLLRHLGHNYRDELIFSRVDFDYLSPDYPVRKPGQLILHFAEELRLYARTRNLENHLDNLHTKVIALHEALSADPFSEDWRETLTGSAFGSILREFSTILRETKQRLVLVLDTCEELTKLQPVGGELPNLEATYFILEALHAAVPDLRVIFAGRRPLALSGLGWQVEVSGRSYLPERKDYLRLHILRGFTRQQAQTYLSEKRGLNLTSELEAAVLENSRETGDPGNIQLEHRPANNGERYNPFDLSLYATWLSEVPNLKPEVIRTGEIDPYINLRIVKRIRQPEICALLPAVAVLSRFNAEMLRPLFEGSDTAFLETYRQLGEEEWINLLWGDESLGRFLQVEPNLAPRLRAFYLSQEHWSEYQQVCRLLGPHLAELIRSRSLGELNALYIEPALTLLPSEEALRLWEDLAAKIANEANWSWAETLTRQILGLESPLGATDHPLHAALRLTRIAAQLHTVPAYNPAPDWEAARQEAARLPDPHAQRWVEQLATAGIIASQRYRSTLPDPDQLHSFLALLDEPFEIENEGLPASSKELAAALCSGLEGLLDWLENTGPEAGGQLDDTIPDWDRSIETWAYRLQATDLHLEIRAFALAQAGRTLALRKEWKRARSAFEQAERLAATFSQQPTPRRWSYWRSPFFPADRIRLELLRLLPASVRPIAADRQLGWLRETVDRVETTDANRLASLVIQLSLDHGLELDRKVIDALEVADHYRYERPECYAHTVVPPLAVSNARVRLAMGNDTAALQALSERIEQARKSADLLTQQVVERARLQTARRSRLAERGEAVYNRLQDSESMADIFAAWPFQAVTLPANRDLPAPTAEWSLARLYCWWDCQRITNSRAAVRALELLGRATGPRRWDPGDITPEVTFLALALREAELVSKAWEQALYPQARPGLTWAELAPTFAAEQRGPRAIWGESEARLALRGATLEGELPQPIEAALAILLTRGANPDPSNSPPEDWPGRIASGVGKRRLAELALEEGELLALRLPDRAYPLLGFAAQQFARAGDPLGGWIAGLRAAIAALHASDTSLARQAIKDWVQPNYQALQTSPAGAGFPIWEAVSAAGQELSSGLTTLLSRPYGAWLARLAICLDYLKIGIQPSRMRELFGAELPVELDLAPFPLPQATTQATQGAAAPPEPTSAPARKGPAGISRIGCLILLISTAACTFIAIIGGLFPENSSLYNVAVYLTCLPQIGVTVGAILLSVGIIQFLIVRSRAALAAGEKMAVQITEMPGTAPSRASPEQAVPAMVTLFENRWRAQLAWPLFRIESFEIARWSGETPGLAPYRQVAENVPPSVSRHLQALNEILGKYKTSILPLRVTPALDGAPWEAMLTTGLLKDTQELRPALRFFRSAEATAATPAPLLKGLEDRVSLVASSTWTLLAEESWKPFQVGVAILSPRPQIPVLPVKVLHLIGTPVTTSSGLFMQIGEIDFLVRQQTRLPGESAGRSGQRLLAADDLPLREIALIIVQDEPAEIRTRMDSDREAAALLRQYAGTLSTAGAQAVLVLPKLHPDQARTIITYLAQKLRLKKTLPPRVLIGLAAEIQAVILGQKAAQKSPPADASGKLATESQPGLQETHLEQALDVTLFLRAP